MVSDTADTLRRAGERAWDERWAFKDTNGDGLVTISDAPGFLEWLFFAPGDWVMLFLMRYHPEVALFLEVSPDSLSGQSAAILSFAAWLTLMLILRAFLK